MKSAREVVDSLKLALDEDFKDVDGRCLVRNAIVYPMTNGTAPPEGTEAVLASWAKPFKAKRLYFYRDDAPEHLGPGFAALGIAFTANPADIDRVRSLPDYQ